VFPKNITQSGADDHVSLYLPHFGSHITLL